MPGDRIVGILTPGEGVTVYPIQAEALQQFEDSADQWIDLRWDIDPDNPERFPSKIRVVAVNAPGTLAEISEIMAASDANIATILLSQPDPGLAQMIFGVEVWDLNHLNRVVRELRSLGVVSEVERVN